MFHKELLTYAIDSCGDLVFIDEVNKGLSCNCICPFCNEKLIAKNGGTKRIHHFAHASGVDCDAAYETMLHKLAKVKIQEAFLSKDIFLATFEYRSYCPNANSCKYVKYDNCYTSSTRSFNLKDYYDSCEQEAVYDTINRRSDLKIFDSQNPNKQPIYIEFCVTHASDSAKLHNGGKIIEIRLESENDIDAIIMNGFVESLYPMDRNNEEVVCERRTCFYGFKNEDYSALSINHEIEFSRYILYNSGKSQCYQDTARCKTITKAHPNSLLEICIHTPVAFGIYEMVKWQGYKRYGIKNCLYCKNYVDSYDGMGKLCCLYKHLRINRLEKHDTARSQECLYFKLNEEKMNEEIHNFESLDFNEYTIL